MKLIHSTFNDSRGYTVSSYITCYIVSGYITCYIISGYITCYIVSGYITCYIVSSYITCYNPTDFTLTAYLRLNKSAHKGITKLIRN